MGASLKIDFIPPPSITSFTPENGPVGTSVIITGTNFDTTPANNIVFFGATQAVVIASSLTSLTVLVPNGATYEPITVLVDGLIAYSVQSFIVIFTGGKAINTSSFDSKIDFVTGSNPIDIVTADLDGDGKSDLIIVNKASNTVSVFRNTSLAGRITYEAKLDYITGTDPYNVSVGDYNSDGKLDLAIVNETSNTVSIFRNTSSGSGIISFADKLDFITGDFPNSIVTEDFDLDGKPDIAIANLYDNTISILLNTSTSEIAIGFRTKIDFPSGIGPRSVAARDLDGDGKPDLIIANVVSDSISTLINTSSRPGSANFGSKVDYYTGDGAGFVAVGDLDGDNRMDLIIANNYEQTVSALRNTSTNSGVIILDPKIDFDASRGNPGSISVGDLNGDGKVDLSVTNLNQVLVLENISSNIGSIDFGSKVDYSAGSSVFASAIGDWDGDGKSDFGVVNYDSHTVSIFRNSINEVDINSFSLAEQTSPATIDEVNHTINIEVTKGTAVSTLTPTFTLSTGSSAKIGTIDQESGITVNDYSLPVTYTVTAENRVTTQDWLVSVSIAPNTETDITSFSLAFGTIASIINSDSHTIEIEVEYGTYLGSQVATFILSEQARAEVNSTVQVSGSTSNDFTYPVVYSIIAEDGITTQDWLVTVSMAQYIQPIDYYNVGFKIVTTTSVDILYTYVTYTNDQEPTAFTIERKLEGDPDANYTLIATLASTHPQPPYDTQKESNYTYRDEGLEEGLTYSYRLIVRANTQQSTSTVVKHRVGNTLNVPDDYGKIQEAIDAAIDNDVIEVGAGTYIENIDLMGKIIILKSVSGAHNTIIKPLNADVPAIGLLRREKNVIIDGFTLTEGAASRGSAIKVDPFASPLIKNCIIQNNTGSALYIQQASAIVENCIIDNQGSNFWISNDGGHTIIINSVIVGTIERSSNDIYPPIVLNSVLDKPRGKYIIHYSNVIGGWKGTDGSELGIGNIDIDPAFVDTENNNYALLDHSFMIGAGIDSINIDGTAYFAPKLDFNGDLRPNPTGSNLDIGAIENAFGTPQIEINDPSDLVTSRQDLNIVEFTWSDNSDNESHFVIEYSNQGEMMFVPLDTVVANTTTFRYEQLDCNQAYDFRLKAIQGLASSNFSNISPADLFEFNISINEDIADSIIYCEGSFVTLEGPEGYEIYQWSNGMSSRSITVTEEDMYSLEIGNSTCLTNYGDSVSVIMAPIQAIPTIIIDGYYLTSSEGVEYSWYLNGGLLNDTSRTIIANKKGFYSVEVFNQWGCSLISDEVQVLVTGISDFEKADWLAYPNPFNTNIKIPISIEEHNTQIDITLLDMSGRVVIKESFSQQKAGDYEYILDVNKVANNLKNGTFILRVEVKSSNGLEVFTKKIIYKE